jgi:hypothetical protein
MEPEVANAPLDDSSHSIANSWAPLAEAKDNKRTPDDNHGARPLCVARALGKYIGPGTLGTELGRLV